MPVWVIGALELFIRQGYQSGQDTTQACVYQINIDLRVGGFTISRGILDYEIAEAT